MPYLAIVTSAEVTLEAGNALVKEASRVIGEGTGKPEQYVMVKLQGGQPLLFAASDAPAAFLEVKSIGYPPEGPKFLTRSLCELVTRHLGVSGHRTYVVFEDVKAAMWGNDGAMFG